MKNKLLQLIKLIMKVSYYGFFLQIIFLNVLLANGAKGQKNLSVKEVFIDLQLKDASIVEAFNSIESKTNYEFNYNRPELDLNTPVNINSSHISVADVLMDISKQTGLKFRQVNRSINVDRKIGRFSKGVEILLAEVEITGKVTDETGENLPGVNVIVKGTSLGSVTDVQGNYKLEAPDENSILVFSSVGYLEEEITIRNQTVIDLTMVLDITALEEVVVVGYGDQAKALLTNAVSTVTADQLADRAVVSFAEALAGQVAGVQIQQTSGAPGSGPVIKIRGVGSISGGGLPLYVVDGIPIDNVISTASVMGGNSRQQPQNPMASINPNDIESISILKDASSTAIYGSRGSNGVIIITTKKGVAGKAKISFNISQGMQTVAHKIDMMNTAEWVNMETDRLNWSWVNYGGPNPIRNLDDPNSVRTPGFMIPDEFSNPSSLLDTDWQDEMFRVAPMTTVSLSASGGSEKARYYISGDYVNQEGVIINSGFQKFSLRANLDADLSSRVRVGLYITPTFSISRMTRAGGESGNVRDALKTSPVFGAYKADGTYDFQGPLYNYDGVPGDIDFFDNPIATTIESDLDFKQFRVLVSAFLVVDITDDLIFKTTISSDINYFSQDSFTPSTVGRPGTIIVSGYATGSSNISWVNENTLTYTKTFNDNHNVSVLGGFTAQRSQFEYHDIFSTGFPNDQVRTLNAGVVNSATQRKSAWALASFLARATYDYKRKYMVNATIRQDGSSRFGNDTKWGTFPSIAVGWRVSEEAFLSNSSLISHMKIRASYGSTGSMDIPDFGSFGLIGANNYILGTGNGSIVNGLAQNTISNPLLSWEETKELDIGFELGLFNDRVYLNADYYNSLTTGLLLNVPIPLTNGFNTALQNIGSVRNKGLELLIETRNFVGDFSWNTSFNISFNENVVESLGITDTPIVVAPRNFFNELAYTTRVGEPVGSFYGYIAEGVYMTQADADADETKFNDLVGAGDMKFRDVNGPDGNGPDGVLDFYDQGVIGNNLPDFIYGFTSNMTFKGFDFSFTLQGVEGMTVLNGNKRGAYRWISGQGRDYWKSEAEPGDGWTPKPGGVIQNYNTVSTWWLEDASFLRIKNMTLGYTLPKSLFKGKIDRFRIYANAQNLYTFTKYALFNPEVNSGEGDSYRQLTPGLDFGTYPIARTITLGLNVQF